MGRAVAIAVMLGLAGSSAAAGACELGDVLRARAAIADSVAAYTEERHVHYLTEPVQAAGELRYRSPGHLEMLVRQPKPESFFYQDGVLTIDGGGASGREISVDSQILLSTLFTALVGTLSGDESKLRGAFDLFFSDSDCAWRLTMIPKAERVRGKVEGVEIRGTKARIEQIVFTLANGDRSVLTIRETE